MIKLENCHFTTFNEIIDWGNDYQWVNRGDDRLRGILQCRIQVVTTSVQLKGASRHHAAMHRKHPALPMNCFCQKVESELNSASGADFCLQERGERGEEIKQMALWEDKQRNPGCGSSGTDVPVNGNKLIMGERGAS